MSTNGGINFAEGTCHIKLLKAKEKITIPLKLNFEPDRFFLKITPNSTNFNSTILELIRGTEVGAPTRITDLHINITANILNKENIIATSNFYKTPTYRDFAIVGWIAIG